MRLSARCVDPSEDITHAEETNHLMCNFSFTPLLLMQLMLRSEFFSQLPVLHRIVVTHSYLVNALRGCLQAKPLCTRLFHVIYLGLKRPTMI